MTVQYPQRVYDFTSFSQTRPNQQQPGDRLDAQFANHQDAITSLIETIAGLTTRQITFADLDPNLVTSILAQINNLVVPQVQIATQAALSSQADADAIKALLSQATQLTAQALVLADQVQGIAPGIIQDLQDQQRKADDALTRLDQVLPRITNAENDAAFAAATAQDWAIASQDWAEHMPDTIPPNTLATMGITGDHWSSRWWANQASQLVSSITDDAQQAHDAAIAAAASAAQAASDAAAAAASWDQFDDRYLGAKSSPPTTDNDGNPLQQGTIYFDTTNHQSYVWNGTSWQSLASAGSIFANTVVYTPNPTQAIAATNVQAAIDEVAAERATVTALNNEISDRIADVNSEEAARIAADATLQTDINTRATQTALAAETTARQNADSTLTSNLSAETTNRQNADTALQNDINTRATQTALTSETNARIAADNTITTNYQAADTTLQTNITNEANARIAADALKVDKTANTGAAVLPAGTSAQRPASPAAGYVRYNSDTGKFEGYAVGWGTLGGGAAISDTPPSNPAHGDLWWESDTGNLYIRFDDGTSQQWVQLNYMPDYSGVALAAQKYARLAAQFNPWINADMFWSQQSLGNAVTTAGGYPCDGFRLVGTLVGTNAKAQRFITNGGNPLQKGKGRIVVNCTTAKGSLAAGDYLAINAAIEGYDLVPSAWGNAGGLPLIVRFGFKGPAGTYGFRFSNNGGTLFYATSFTIANANTDTIVTLLIPPPPNGSAWTYDAQAALTMAITLASGTNFTGAAGSMNAWQGSNILGPNGMSNGVSSTANQFELFDVRTAWDFEGVGLVDPGFTVPDIETELMRCRRRFQAQSYTFSTYAAAGNVQYAQFDHVPTMRAAPVCTRTVAGSTGNCSAPVVATNGIDRVVFQTTVTATGAANFANDGWTFDSQI